MTYFQVKKYYRFIACILRTLYRTYRMYSVGVHSGFVNKGDCNLKQIV